MSKPEKDNDINKQKKEDDTMATMAKPNQGVYEFNVKKESYSRVVDRINEERIKADFIKTSYQVATQYKKPKNK